MALTDEQIETEWDSRKDKLKGWDYGGEEVMYEGAFNEAARAIESAACAERDARIAELERQLAEARKDAERWATTVEVSEDVLRHPDKRKFPFAVSAYMHEINHGHGIKYAVDAAIRAMKEQT